MPRGETAAIAARPVTMPSLRLRLLVAAAVLVVAFLAASAGTAAAATPCWKQIYNDWYDNGKIDRTYSVACYREALARLPEDARDYTSLGDDIEAAMQAALHPKDTSRRTQGSNMGRDDAMGGGRTSGSGNRTLQAQPSQELFSRGVDDIGSASADSIPLPLIVLAGVGGALLAAGAAGAARRKLVARRAPPQ